MSTRADVKELLESFILQGETLDPEDMSVLYGWIFSASVAIQPFAEEHREFCDLCRNSFDPPRARLQAGLNALKKALEALEAGAHISEKDISADLSRLMERVLKR